MATTTTLYLRQGIGARVAVVPSGFLSAWTNASQPGAAHAGGGASMLMESNPGAATVSTSLLVGTYSTNATVGTTQFLSGALAAMATQAAANWTVDINLSSSGASWTPYVSVFLVNGSTGAVRTTVVDRQVVGVGSRAGVGTQTTVYSATIAGAAFTPVAGDYLCVEIGMGTATAGAVTFNTYSDGSAVGGADNVSSTGSRCSVICPAVLVYQPVVLYLRPSLAATVPTKPAGYLSAWFDTTTGAANAGSGATQLSRTAGTGQTGVVVPGATTGDTGMAQFLSPTLVAQTIPAVAIQEWYAAATTAGTWSAWGALYLVNGSTGAVRATLKTEAAVGNGARTANNAERTVLGTATSTTVTALAGDYLAYEVGTKRNTTAPGSTLYAEGSTASTGVDDQAVASVQSALGISFPLVFQVAGVVAGTFAPAAGAGDQVSGTTSPVVRAGTASGNAGVAAPVSGLAAPAVRAGTASGGAGAGVSLSGSLVPANMSFIVSAQAGASVASVGVVSSLATSGVVSAPSGASVSLSGAATVVGRAGTASGNAGASASLSGVAVPAVVPQVSGSFVASAGAAAFASGIARNPSAVSVIVLPSRFGYGLLKPALGTTPDRSSPYSRGLIGAWLLNEGTGPTIAESSGLVPPGTGVNGTPVAWVASPYGTALDMAGTPIPSSSTGIPVGIPLGPSNQLNPTTQVTVRVLLYLVPWSAYENKIFTKESANPPYASYNLSGQGNTNSTLGFGVGVSGGSGTSFAIAPANPALNAWHDVVGTYDGATVRLYVDGVLLASTGLTGAIFQSPSRAVLGGADYYSVQPFHGKIAAAWLYDRALSAAEIQALYARPFAMYQAPAALRFLAAPAVGAPSVSGTLSCNAGAGASVAFVVLPVGKVAAVGAATASVVGVVSPTAPTVVAGSLSAPVGAAAGVSGSASSPGASRLLVVPSRFGYGLLKPPIGARLDPSNPLSRGLVGAWLLNEGTGGRVEDSSPSNVAGVVDTAHVVWVPSPYGPSLSLANAVHSPLPIDLSSSAKLNPAAFVTVRVLYYYVNMASQHKLVSREVTSPPYDSYLLDHGGASNLLSFSIGVPGGGNNPIPATCTANPSDGWHDIVGTYDGATIRLYWDGVLRASTAQTGLLFQNSGRTSIGSSDAFGGGDPTDTGKVAGFWLYDRALSAPEIQALYARPFAMYAPPPALRFLAVPSSVPSGTIASDAGAVVAVFGTVVPTTGTVPGAVSAPAAAAVSVAGSARPASLPGPALVAVGASVSFTGAARPSAVAATCAAFPGAYAVVAGTLATGVVSSSTAALPGALVQVTGSTVVPAAAGTASVQAAASASAPGSPAPSNVAGTTSAQPGASAAAVGTPYAPSLPGSALAGGAFFSTIVGVARPAVVLGAVAPPASGYANGTGAVSPAPLPGAFSAAPGGYDSVAGVATPATVAASPAAYAGISAGVSGIVSPVALSASPAAYAGSSSLVTGNAVPSVLPGAAQATAGAAATAAGGVSGATIAGTAQATASASASVQGTGAVVGALSVGPGASASASGTSAPAQVAGTVAGASGASVSLVGTRVPSRTSDVFLAQAGAASVVTGGVGGAIEGSALPLAGASVSVAGVVSSVVVQSQPLVLLLGVSASVSGIVAPVARPSALVVSGAANVAASGVALPVPFPAAVSAQVGGAASLSGVAVGSSAGTAQAQAGASSSFVGTAVPVVSSGTAQAQAGAVVAFLGGTLGQVPGSIESGAGAASSVVGTVSPVQGAGTLPMFVAGTVSLVGSPAVVFVASALSAVGAASASVSASVLPVVPGSFLVPVGASASVAPSVVPASVSSSALASSAAFAGLAGSVSPAALAGGASALAGASSSVSGFSVGVVPCVVSVPSGASASVAGVAATVLASGTVSASGGASLSVVASVGNRVAGSFDPGGAASVASSGQPGPVPLAGASVASPGVSASVSGTVAPPFVVGTFSGPVGASAAVAGLLRVGATAGSAQASGGVSVSTVATVGNSVVGHADVVSAATATVTGSYNPGASLGGTSPYAGASASVAGTLVVGSLSGTASGRVGAAARADGVSLPINIERDMAPATGASVSVSGASSFVPPRVSGTLSAPTGGWCQAMPPGHAVYQKGDPLIVSVTISTRRDGVGYMPPFFAKFSEPRPGQVFPDGSSVDYRVLVRVPADVEVNDEIILVSFGDYVLPFPEEYIVLDREWSGGGVLALRALLVKSKVIGGRV